MLDKTLFRATERKLYNYFSKDRKVNAINRKIELLNKQIEEIKTKIQNNDIFIPEESRSITYDERVQSSSDGTSYAERTAVRIVDNLEKERVRKSEEISHLEEELRTIEADCCIIGSNMNFLKDEYIEILKTKYSSDKFNIADWEIGQRINKSEVSVYRLRCRLIEDIANWEVWYSKEN